MPTHWSTGCKSINCKPFTREVKECMHHAKPVVIIQYFRSTTRHWLRDGPNHLRSDKLCNRDVIAHFLSGGWEAMRDPHFVVTVFYHRQCHMVHNNWAYQNLKSTIQHTVPFRIYSYLKRETWTRLLGHHINAGSTTYFLRIPAQPYPSTCTPCAC